MNEHDADHDADLTRELRALRAEPREEFARDLDARAARWIREGERPRRRPAPRVVVPALAAGAVATVAIVLVAGGGGGEEPLRVAAVPAPQGQAEGLSAAPQRDSGAQAPEEQAERSFLTSPSAAPAGAPLAAPYTIPAPARARVRLGDRETQVDVPAGEGRLEISTEGLEPGSYNLEIELPPVPQQRARVEVLPGD